MPIGYKELAERLRSAIASGTYAPGDTIPTLRELMSQYDTTDVTARRAVNLLRSEGLVTPARRRGTVVRDRTRVTLPFTRYAAVLAPELDPHSGSPPGPWESACAAQGITGETRTVTVDQVPAPADIAGALGLTPGDPVVHRVRHMLAGTQVAQISESFLPLTLVQGTPLAEDRKVKGGIYRALTALGRAPSTATERITARMPSHEEAETLSLDVGAPVMSMFRITKDEDGQPLEALRVTCVGDRVDLLYEDLPIRR